MTMNERFDPSALKPGDETGVTWESWGGQAEFVTRVVAIHEDGVIETEGDEFHYPDGLEVDIPINGVPSPNRKRLCPPTDEGRRNSLSDDIWGDLERLLDRRPDLSLDEMRRLAATAKALLVEFPGGNVIDVPSVDDTFTPKLIHGA